MDGFFYYRLPNNNAITGLQCEWVNASTLESSVDGVIVTSFKKDVIYNLTRPQNLELDFLTEFKIEELSSNIHISKAEYLDQVAECKAFCKIQNGKIVLSRVKKGALPKSSNLKIIYKAVCDAYPKAFVYVCNVPGEGLWIGASPEKLLEGKTPKLNIDALAGSRNVHDRFEWTEKEFQEQSMVASNISEKLEKLQLKFEKTELKTVTAGSIEHLFNSFTVFNCQDPLALANELHPTPAVSGLPVDAALDAISKIEKHNRNLYAGIVGVKNKGQMNLYVNLRCGQIFKDSIDLYVGGGITVDSDPLLEWKETEFKSQTLLSVFEKM